MLRSMGFEVGWGDTVGRVKESMHELLDILQVCPWPAVLQLQPSKLRPG